VNQKSRRREQPLSWRKSNTLPLSDADRPFSAAFVMDEDEPTADVPPCS
jgi:hypothetical protein